MIMMCEVMTVVQTCRLLPLRPELLLTLAVKFHQNCCSLSHALTLQVGTAELVHDVLSNNDGE